MSIYKNDINVSLNIGANTQQAQQQIQALQASLNKLSSAGVGSNIAPNIQKAAAAAQELQMHLQKAYNTKTGNLDLSLLNRSLATSKEGIQGLSTSLINAGQDGRAAFVNLAKSIASANQPMLKTNTLLGNMWTTLKNTARWQISSSILQGFMGSIQKAYGYAQDLNKSLTDIRIVTGYSADKMKDFAVEANNAAKALSTTTNEYAKASLIYFQQGLNDQEVKERTDVTVKMANVTRESAQTVSDQMTAIWNNFDDGSKSLEYYADVITALGAATASSTDEISQGLEKFAAVAETVGLSYEYATSALATITAETRQSADVVGTALKTLFARIQGLSLGETLDDGTDLNKYSEALAKVGISIKDQNGGLKDMDTLLDEMAAKWQTLNKDQQVALAQTVAGVRQYTQLVALMDNWDAMQTNLKTAENSEGTLQEQQDIYAESWEAASRRVKAALEEIYTALLDDTFFIKLTNTIADLTNGVGEFIKGFGGVKNILLSIASIFLVNFAHKIPAAFESLRYNISILFGGASKEAEKLSNTFSNFTQKQVIDNSKLTAYQSEQLKYGESLLQVKTKLAKVNSTLSESERLSAQIAIENLQAQQQKIDEIYARTSEMRSQIQSVTQEIGYSQVDNIFNSKNFNNIKADDPIQSQVYSNHASMINKLTESYASLNSVQDRLKTFKIGDIATDSVNRINELTNSFQNLNKISGNQTARQEIAALASSIKVLFPQASNEANELDSIIENLLNSGKANVIKDFEKLRDILQNTELKGKDLKKILEEMDVHPSIITKLQEMGILERKAEREANEIVKRFKELQANINHAKTGIESLSKAMGGFGSVAMGINSLVTAYKTLENPDISGFEKFLSVITSLTMAVPMMISGVGTLKNEFIGLHASIYKTTGAYASQNALISLNNALNNTNRDTITTLNGLLIKGDTEKAKEILINKMGLSQDEAEIVLQKIKIDGNEKENGQMAIEIALKKQLQKANTKLILSYAALSVAVVAVIAAIAALVIAYKKWQKTTREAQAKMAQENLEQTTKAAEEAKTAYEELTAAVEKYNESINKIDKASQSMKEYSESIKEANKNAKELIETYGLYGKDNWYYDSEGIIRFKPSSKNPEITVLEEAIMNAEITVQEANITVQGAKIAQEQINQANKVENFTDKVVYGTTKTDEGEFWTNLFALAGAASSQAPIPTQTQIELVEENVDGTKTEDPIVSKAVNTLSSLGKEALELMDFSNQDEILSALGYSSLEEAPEVIQKIINDSNLSTELKNLALSAIEASEKMSYFADSAAASRTEQIHGTWAKNIATQDGELNQTVYDSALRIIGSSNKEVYDNAYSYILGDDYQADLASVAGKNWEAYTKFIQEQTGRQDLNVQNADQMAQLYSNLYYNGVQAWYKNGKIEFADPSIEAIEINPEQMRWAAYNQLMTDKADTDYVAALEDQKINDQQAIENFMNSTSGITDYGENLQGILLNAIASGLEGVENIDLSALFSELNPSEWEGLMNAENPLEFLKMLGLTPEILEELGVESAAIFAHAARDSLAAYDSESYLESADTKGEKEAEEAGVDIEKFEKYRDILENTTDAYEDNREGLNKVALANLRLDEGVKTLADDWDDLNEVMSDPNADPYEMADALTKIEPALQNILNLNTEQFELLPPDFAKKNWKLIQDVVNGVEGAVDDLRDIAGEEILLNIEGAVDTDGNLKKEIAELHTYISNLDQEQFTVGVALDPKTQGEFIEQCNNIIAAAGMTAEQAQAYFASMGYDVTLKKDTEPITQEHTVKWPKYEDPAHPLTVTSWGEETWQDTSEAQALAIETITPNGSYGGGIEVKDAPSPSASSGKSGGGGSSGSSAEPLEYEDEIERYHENTRAIERLTRALDKVSTAKDRAFGKHRLNLIDDEIEATEALVQQQRALLAETREYLKQDFAEIQQYGFTYDEFGELTNYDEVMKEQIDKYNAVVATGNADAIEAAKKEYEEFKENMEQYEETLTQYEEAQAQLQEYINQVVDLKLEKITTEVEIKILVNDKELTRLEYLLRKIEYEGKGAADAIALMGRQFEQISQKAKPIQEAIDKIYEQARVEGRGLLEEEVREIKTFYQDGEITTEEKKRMQEIYDKAASEDRMLTQAEEEQIQEYKEQLLELNEEVMDIVETIEGKFIETLEELNGKVDESIGRFATYTGMFQTLSDVITLSGKAGSKYGMDMLNTLSARTVANASTAMRSNLRSYEALDQIYKEEQANLERAIKTGDERLIKQYQDRLHEVEIMRETSYESMLSSWSEALQAANDLFDTKLTNMITSLKQNLGDIDKLVEIYDRAVELEDLYISGNKSIYELSKLARDVGKDIDKTANIIAKNKLVNLLDQINKMRAEGVKLSQYDLEYWQAKYELEVAEIALQEAQEAKAQVILTRNTAGGWGYTYVADAEAISEAQQNYEDSLYNMQELHDEYIRDYSERLIKNRQDLVNALQNLDKTSLTFEEDALRLKEHHFKQEEYLIDELNKAYQRAGVSYQDTLLAQTYGGASLEDSHTNFINSVVKMIKDELLPGYQEFQESVDDINSQAGTTVEDAMDKIFESSVTMEDEVIKNINDLTSGVKEVSDEIWNFQETYGEAISKMLADNEEYYSKTIKMYQNFMAETEADKWLQYFDDMRGPGEVLGVAGSGATGAMAGNGSTAVTNGAFGDILQQAVGRNDRGNSSSKKTSSSNNRDNDTVYISPTGYVSTKVGIWEWSAYENNPEKLKKEYESQGYNVEKVDSVLEGINKDRNDKGVQEVGPGHEDYDRLKKLATGGYTGSWGSEGRLAILHEKELVLNKYDTENMLDMVNTLRDIDWRAKLSELWTNIEEHFIAPIFSGGDKLQQDVRIEASFPGVSNHTEIEEAFNNLINTASQYANRKRY